MITHHDAEMLKAWFSAHAMHDVHEQSDPDNWTYPDASGFTIETVRDTIDAFVKSKENT